MGIYIEIVLHFDHGISVNPLPLPLPLLVKSLINRANYLRAHSSATELDTSNLQI